jgi:CBS domain-containing protein
MNVSQLMRTDLVTTDPDTGLTTLFRLLARVPSLHIYVVDQDHRMLGLITSYDLLKALSPFYMDSNLAKALPDDDSFLRHAFRANAHQTASDIMERDVPTLKPSDHFVEAEVLIRERGGYVLPIVDDKGRLVGEVTRKMIIKYLARTLLEDGTAIAASSTSPAGQESPEGKA